MKNLLFSAFIMLAFVSFSIAQGCSDAGFCTINSFKPHGDSVTTFNNQFKIGAGYGTANNSISVINNYVEYDVKLSAAFSIDTKLTTIAAMGNDISTFGLSDAFINANYAISSAFTISAGLKIPLADGNKTKDNLALPMDYQPSLGTFDILLGMGYTVNNFQIVAAYQQPLTQNTNAFVAEIYPTTSKLRSFVTTNKFKRSGDVLLRVSYPFKLNEKWRITPSILPIVHLTTDQYSDASGVVRNIENSQGLTLNGNVYFDYQLNAQNAIQLNVGAPFVVRSVRPDGLTRGFVLNVEYAFRF